MDIYKRGILRLNLSARTSDDNVSWSGWVNVSNPSGLVDSSARYIQYKAILETDDGNYAPYLQWVNISYDQVPTINFNQTYPAVPVFGDTVKINANVTNSSGIYIRWVNFTLTAPNGTDVIDNENGTNYNNDMWNSSSFVIDQTGVWIVNITAESNNSRTDSSSWTFSIGNPMNVSLNRPEQNNNSIDFEDVKFNCSAAYSGGSNYELDNVSLYSDYGGVWSLIETDGISGTSYDMVKVKNVHPSNGFIDKMFVWNCLAYDNGSNSDWGDDNYTFSSWDLGSYEVRLCSW
jgi:hypothetical protein